MLDNLYGQETVRFANFLSPLLQDTYDAIATYVGSQLALPVTSAIGQSLTEFPNGLADVGFVCGLEYVRLSAKDDKPVELLAAPVLHNERYQQRPIYYSDVVVRRGSPCTSFDDLAGCSWVYNEEASHSGYNLVLYSLLERHKHGSYFGKTLKSGSHLQSLQLVLKGKADVTVIDSHVLDMVLQTDGRLAEQLSVIDRLGPSSIPPVVVASRLPAQFKRDIQLALITMHLNPALSAALRTGGIERFVPVRDEQYDDIRHMLACTQSVYAL
jgi:ABC-type phosphate/phosphonate transport system substrate-binding protein